MTLACPVCSSSLTPSSLEPHLRFELDLPVSKCRLCPQSFCSEEDALGHFRGDGARHPGQEPRLIQPPTDKAQKERLRELLRLARGGQEAVQKRLCLCGLCQLMCREDTSGTEPLLVAVAQPSLPSTGTQDRPKLRKVGQAAHSPLEEPPDATPSMKKASPNHDDELPVEVEEEIEDQRAGFHEEALEEEEHISVDVKPSVSELKPSLVQDGKLTCLQCGKRIGKDGFTIHVLSDHIPGKHFQCLLCEFSTNRKDRLVTHQKSQHGRQSTTETFSCSVTSEARQEWVRLCFGDVKSVGYAEARCRECDKSVRQRDVRRHIATTHLKKTMHKCRVCSYQSKDLEISDANRHVKSVHKVKPGSGTIDSSGLRQFEPIIRAMIPQFFEKLRTK